VTRLLICPSNEFPDCLSRNYMNEIYKYQDLRICKEKAIEVLLHRGNWKKFAPARIGGHCCFLGSQGFNRGCGHILKAAEDMSVT